MDQNLSIEGMSNDWLPAHIEEAALMVPQSCLYLYLLSKVIHHLKWEPLDNFPWSHRLGHYTNSKVTAVDRKIIRERELINPTLVY